MCCGNDITCQLFQKQIMDVDQAHFAPNSFYAKCTNNATGAIYINSSSVLRRRLLGDSVQACYTSQYNSARGDTVCYSCPQGKTNSLMPYGIITSTRRQGHLRHTRSPGTSQKQCICLPGYYAVRDAQNMLVTCNPCGVNRHRNVNMNDTFCAPCPSGLEIIFYGAIRRMSCEVQGPSLQAPLVPTATACPGHTLGQLTLCAAVARGAAIAKGGL